MTESEARPPRRTEKDYLREKEEEEEALERKKAEKKAREKEVTYQVRTVLSPITLIPLHE